MKINRPLAGGIALLCLAVALGVGVPLRAPAQQQVAALSPGVRDATALRMSWQSTLPGKRSHVAHPGDAVPAPRRRGDAAVALAVESPPADALAADAAPRGLVRAVREATLSSRLAARIAELPLADGASFKAGDLLVRFDCERQVAETRAAAAAVDVQRKTVETNEELDKFESIGKNDLSISKSQLDKSRAEADVLKSQMSDCRLVAPFSGRVIERMARKHEVVTPTQPLLRVVDTSELELELIVPSAWLLWLREGAPFRFSIDETGQTVNGTVTRLTPTVDPVSKTIKVIGQFNAGKKAGMVLPGMSGSARFANAAARGRG